jgi:2,3-bisphosphoglycerate-dependent phosphoglycerate mutase
MNDINIFLCRHGESTGNILGDVIGQDNDTQLTEKGIAQANFLGHRFRNENIHFDKIFSSTYPRAKATAEIVRKVVGYKPELILTDALREYNPGSFKGKSRAEIYADFKTMQSMAYLNMGFLFPGGESYMQVERRAATFIEDNIIYNKDILAEAEKKELNIAVFTHGMTAKTIIRYIAGCDQSFMWKIRIGNASISHLVFNDRGWFLNSINDCGHLTTA